MTGQHLRINMPGFTVDIAHDDAGYRLSVCGKGDSIHKFSLEEREALWRVLGAEKLGDALAVATQEAERLRMKLSVTETQLAATEAKLSAVRGTLRIFREFINVNAKVWNMGANVCHHPMWGMVCEALGPVNDMKSNPIEWQFIYAENRRSLGEIE